MEYKDTLNLPSQQFLNGPQDATPILGFPIYGEWHVKQHTIAPSNPTWMRELNLDPRSRVAAGLGAEVVRKLNKDHFEIDIAYSVPGLGRFRVNVFQQRGNVSIAIRAIPTNILAFEDLCLPGILETIAREPRGLVLVTGTTGSGRSTAGSSASASIRSVTFRCFAR